MIILYVLRSTAHFAYHETIVRSLCASGHEIQMLFDRGWSDKSRSLESVCARVDGAAKFSAGWSLRRVDWWRRWIFATREVLSYSSYLSRTAHSAYYTERWRGYLPGLVQRATRRLLVRRLLAQPFTQNRLRDFEHIVPPDPVILQWLKYHRPDVLVASPVNMRFSEEVEYVKAALALGIATVVPVLSWDNLTTKGLIHVVPDLTLVWNEWQREEAVKIHHLPPEKVIVTGSPFFDKWLKADRLALSREDFCRRIGLNPYEPFVLYLGSSANIARDETWLVYELARYLREHPNPDLQKMSILVRPHPANARVYEQLELQKVSVWPKEGALPDSEDALRDFYNSMLHCVTTVGINTTGMIDSVIVDKPCLAVMTDRYRDTQLQATHFKYLLDADVLEIANSPEDCANKIGALLSGTDSTHESRQRFVRDFARPRGVDKPAGEVAARMIEMTISGESVVRTIDKTMALA